MLIPFLHHNITCILAFSITIQILPIFTYLDALGVSFDPWSWFYQNWMGKNQKNKKKLKHYEKKFKPLLPSQEIETDYLQPISQAHRLRIFNSFTVNLWYKFFEITKLHLTHNLIWPGLTWTDLIKCNLYQPYLT